MIKMSIESLIMSPIPSPCIVSLRPSSSTSEEESAQLLPIYVGPMEATAIAAALDEKKPARPLTHTFANNMLRAAGGSVSRVVIDRVEGTTFFSTVYLHCNNGMFTRVDARPSDGIAIAIAADAPLYVEESVLEAASFPRSFKPGGDRKIELEEFHKFVESINPEDFVQKD